MRRTAARLDHHPPRARLAPVGSPRWLLVGWVPGYEYPRAIVGSTSTNESADCRVHYYNLLFIDRVTGRAELGKLAHGNYTSETQRDTDACRHVREGVVDAPYELGARRAVDGWTR